MLRADIRVIAATNRDLQRRCSAASSARISTTGWTCSRSGCRRCAIGATTSLPLSEAFLAEIGETIGRPPAGMSRDAEDALLDYPWPGNVRELRNVLERAAILCDGGLIAAEHLALTQPAPRRAGGCRRGRRCRRRRRLPSTGAASRRLRPTRRHESMERAMIEKALPDARFNKSRAAKALGLTRAQLYVRMRRYGLE